MNLEQALTIFADLVNRPGNKSGPLFYISSLDADVRRYLTLRGILTPEYADLGDWGRLTGWVYLTPLGEREYERVLGEDPYDA